MNPQHSVPFIDDEDFYLAESGAINIYLVEKYGKDDALYPNDPQKRAVINARLLYSAGTVWNRLFQTYISPVLFQKIGINDLIMDRLDDAFNVLNSFLDGNNWLAGDDISVADYTLVPIVACAEAVGYGVSKHENVSAWLARCKETMEDFENLNQAGLDQFAKMFHSVLNQIEKNDE